MQVRNSDGEYVELNNSWTTYKREWITVEIWENGLKCQFLEVHQVQAAGVNVQVRKLVQVGAEPFAGQVKTLTLIQAAGVPGLELVV